MRDPSCFPKAQHRGSSARAFSSSSRQEETEDGACQRAKWRRETEREDRETETENWLLGTVSAKVPSRRVGANAMSNLCYKELER